MYPPTNSYVEVLTLNGTIFGTRAFKRVKLNEVIKVGPTPVMAGVLMKRGRDSKDVYAQKKGNLQA